MATVFSSPVQVLKKSAPRPWGKQATSGAAIITSWASKLCPSPCLDPPSPWGPEAKLTSSGLVGEPTVHARMGVTQTPAFLLAQGLSVILKCIMVWIPFF